MKITDLVSRALICFWQQSRGWLIKLMFEREELGQAYCDKSSLINLIGKDSGWAWILHHRTPNTAPLWCRIQSVKSKRFKGNYKELLSRSIFSTHLPNFLDRIQFIDFEIQKQTLRPISVVCFCSPFHFYQWNWQPCNLSLSLSFMG